MLDALNKLMDAHPRWGFWLCFDRLRLDGHRWNHKRVYRIYRAMGLNLPRWKKRQLPERPVQPLDAPHVVNRTWFINFMSDSLDSGKRFRTLNILADGVREVLGIVIDTSLPGGRVVRTLAQIASWRGLPGVLRLDNGPELISQVLVDWCHENNVELRYIQPGKPNQNAFIERFNKTYRVEVLNAYLFRNLTQVREITEDWLRIDNEERPYRSLGRIPPSQFRWQLENTQNSSYELSA